MVDRGTKVGFGPNLAGSQHEVWRQPLQIAGPSFTEGNDRLVWETTVQVVLDVFKKWNRDGKGSFVIIANFTDVTTQIVYTE